MRRARREGIDLEVAVVFCDRERGEGPQSDAFLDLAGELHLTTVTLSSATSWAPGERAPTSSIAAASPTRRPSATPGAPPITTTSPSASPSYGVELLVLAGYMLVTSADFCTRFALLNLHPALPGGPQGTWQQVIWQLLADEASATGAMVHLATAELDRGPVVAYCGFPIMGLRYDRLWHAFRKQRAALGIEAIAAAEGERQPLFAEIRRQGERREIPLLYQTVREFALEHLLLRDGQVVGVTLEPPLDLSAAVDAELAGKPPAGDDR